MKNGKSYEVYFEKDKFINSNNQEEKIKELAGNIDYVNYRIISKFIFLKHFLCANWINFLKLVLNKEISKY